MDLFNQWLILHFKEYLFLIPIFPLIGFILNGLFGYRFNRGFISFIGVSSVLLSLIFALIAFYMMTYLDVKSIDYTASFAWISSADFNISWSFKLDALSGIMLLVVTGVGSLIHFYSIGYMTGDRGLHKFFAYMNLFVSAMLILVMADNLILMFLGWEGVGLCSYLLIAFWYSNEDFAEAGKKAFIFNRVGDAGFIVGIVLIFLFFGTVNISDMKSIIDNPSGTFISDITSSVFTHEAGGLSICVIITILLFIGATGKSAQIPLYTWLPDAMAGPTPVSALIHAATMVTAGVYMVARLNFIFNFEMAMPTMVIILVVATITAILAGMIGISQNDIKKVLAYSTVSQIGFMFMALASGAYSIGILHLTMHAFFKALLFLSAGSVIIACGHIQDINKMGGLAKKIPVTFYTFLIGALSLSAIIPYISGFVSKDQILESVFHSYGWFWWGLGIIAALFTAAYTWRLMGLTFWGDCKVNDTKEHPISDKSFTMRFTIIVLAILSLFGGIIGVPELLGGKGYFQKFLSPVFEGVANNVVKVPESSSMEYILMLVSLTLGIIISFYFWRIYTKRNKLIDNVTSKGFGKAFLRMSVELFYVDKLYELIIAKPFRKLSDVIFRYFEVLALDKGVVDGLGNLFYAIAGLLRRYQVGNLNVYAFIILIGGLFILLYISYIIYTGIN